MLQQKIDGFLRQEGYTFLQVRPQEAGVYYKKYEDHIKVILGVRCHEGFVLEAEVLEHMRSQLGAYLQGQENYEQIEILTLLLGETAQLPKMREIEQQISGIWLIDLTHRQLLIYEDQPGDFDQLKRKLENLIVLEDWMHGQGRMDPAGKKMQKEKRQSWPWITTGLVVIQILIFLLQEMIGDTEDPNFMYRCGAAVPESIFFHGEYHRLFTCMFLHFGLDHLVNNMIFLSVVGSKLEHYYGRLRFMIVYLLSGIGASCISMLAALEQGEQVITAGASGAIYGIVGAILALILREQHKVEGMSLRDIGLIVFLSAYCGVISSNIDNWGHLGGFFTGVIVALLIGTRKSH